MEDRSIQKALAAVAFIEAHLEEKLDLHRVANASHYSKYHLHRAFADTVGMTLHAYVRRRQLTQAAKLLVFSKRPILQIATLCGYESQQAFTSVFTALYKQSPRRYRAAQTFYPLQLPFHLGESSRPPTLHRREDWRIVHATEGDIPAWMALVRLIVDGFPRLDEAAYRSTLHQRIQARQALLIKDGPTAVGVLLFHPENDSIDFLGVHPLYRKLDIPALFLKKVMGELPPKAAITITTYRAGDRADTGHRKQILELGFSAAELLTEFGYPTQRFVLKKEVF